MTVLPIVGAPTVVYEKAVRAALASVPPYFLYGARIKQIEIGTGRELRALVASYEHGSRKIRLYPVTGGLLRKALTHELWHGADDNFGSPHVFSSHPVWVRLHMVQSYFELPKYRDEALEYFADVGAKYFLAPDRMRITHPYEVRFIEEVVLPALRSIV